MKIANRSFLCLLVGVVLILSGCVQAVPSQPTATTLPPTQIPVTASYTPAPPSATATPIPPTLTPSVTPTLLPSETPTQTETPTPTLPPPTPAGDEAIYFYVIKKDSGGPVACNDSLVALNTGLARTGNIESDVTLALKRLFVKVENFGTLYNPAFRSNIEVTNVKFKAYEGLVSVELNGTYVRSGDRCDDSRVRAQVWTTIRQFPGVKKVYILLNGNLLGDILATGK